MAAKDIRFSTEARTKMMDGVNILANAVRATMGAKGRNVVIGESTGLPIITKDGVTVARAIELQDHFENMGAQMVKEVAIKANDNAGDGTTTATVLAQAFLTEGMKAVAAGMNPLDVKRGIDLVVSAAKDKLAAMAISCNDSTTIARVGTVSANFDPTIGQMIADAHEQVGSEGVVTVDSGTALHDVLNVVEGMQFDRGYMSPHFINDEDSGTAVLEKAFVLLVDHEIDDLEQLLPILEAVAEQNVPLLIIAKEISASVLQTLLVNNVKGVLNVVAVKSPAFGDMRKEVMEDIAAIVAGNPISPVKGTTVADATFQDLGYVEKVIVTHNTTTLVAGAGTQEDIDNRVAEIKRSIKESDSQYDRDRFQGRIAKMMGGVAIIRVGAPTELALKERRSRVDDALAAVQSAIEEGIVAGGGSALLGISNQLADMRGENEDQNVGIRIALRAMQAPVRQILANAGVEASPVVSQLSTLDPHMGYNVLTDEYCNMIHTGIIDPTKVTRCALQYSASVAGTMLTTEAMVTDKA